MTQHMAWTSAYRLSLRLLPSELRLKHGAEMQALFARELQRAGLRGGTRTAFTGVMALLDVLKRAVYERLRAPRAASGSSRSVIALAAAGQHMQPAAVNHGDRQVPMPTTSQLLKRLAVSFAVSFLALTTLLLIPFGTRQLQLLSERGESLGAMVEMLVLAVPFTTALTLPMAVLIAVLWQFMRLGSNGTLAAVRRVPGSTRRLVTPVLGAAVAMTVVSLAVTAELVPRTNARLATVLAGEPVAPSDRSMTIGELADAARLARQAGEPAAAVRAATLEVELQKKLAIPAACLVLSIVGLAIAIRLPRGGALLVLGVSLAVFATYYMMLLAGETLADDMVVSPAVGMWGANALMLAVALLFVWWPSGQGAATHQAVY